MTFDPSTHLYSSIQLTKEVCVQVLAASVGHAPCGGALPFFGQLPTVWVNEGQDDNPCTVNELAWRERERARESGKEGA